MQDGSGGFDENELGLNLCRNIQIANEVGKWIIVFICKGWKWDSIRMDQNELGLRIQDLIFSKSESTYFNSCLINWVTLQGFQAISYSRSINVFIGSSFYNFTVDHWLYSKKVKK
jgi:hypothetical protein